MRRLPPVVVLFLALTIVVSCSADGVIEPVEVSGTNGVPVESDGFDLFENGTSTDPRLVGTYKLKVECDITEDGDTAIANCTGPNTMTNDGGSWEGTCEGTSTWTTTEPDHVHVFDCTYLGSGDYEGLRFVQHLEGIDYPWEYTGTLEPVG